jgi:hypothetical protein
MKIVSALSCFALLVYGCSSSAVYDRSAKHLTSFPWRGNLGFLGEWQPIGEPSRKRTEEEKEKAMDALSQCVQKLTVEIQGEYKWPVPSEAMAAGQLIACMSEKGWQYQVGEVIKAR